MDIEEIELVLLFMALCEDNKSIIEEFLKASPPSSEPLE